MEGQQRARKTKWGAACAPCAIAKTRCIRVESPGGADCDRCRKLSQNCSDRAPKPRKRRQANKALSNKNQNSRSSSQPTNGSSNILEASEAALDSSTREASPGFNQDDPRPPTRAVPQPQKSPYQQEAAPKAPVLGLGFGAPQACTCSLPMDDKDLLSLESDETLLGIYMNQLSPRFPFIVLPPSSTPAQLQLERPFLFKAIKMAASVRNLPSMRAQGHSILRHISEAMLLRSERSLDLLQGILLTLGSYHYHCMTHAQFSNLIHLAMSLVEDMNLNTCHMPQGGSTSILPLMRAHHPPPRTNEERRALLGVWYMSSNSALISKHLGPVRYTKDLNQCLKELSDSAEYQTDELVVQLVRIQNVTNQVFHFHCREQEIDGLPGAHKVTATECLETFQAELDNLWNSVPPTLKTDYVLLCHYKSAYIQLLEPLLMGANLPGTVSHAFSSLSLSGLFKINLFSHFSAAIRAWFDNWLAIPVCSYFCMPQPVSFQLIHACWALIRWVRAAGPAAIKCSNPSIIALRQSTIPTRPLPAMSGVPECPELGSIQPPISGPSATISTPSLDSLKAQILEQPDLRIDVFGILDSMVSRFESASKEMEAAQGVLWNNQTWEVAADHMRIKKLKIERWCEVAAAVVNEGRQVPNIPNGVVEPDRPIGDRYRDTSAEWRLDGLEWLISGDGQDNGQWEADLFDGIMMDADIGAIPGFPSSWDPDAWDGMGVAGRLGTANAHC